MPRILCTVDETDVLGSSGRLIDGVCATCNACGHQEEAFGTSDRSVRRCLAQMRENCPKGASNFYVNANDEPAAAPAVALNDEQSTAVDQILTWAVESTVQKMTLGGLAGTGKTTIIGELMRLCPDLFCAILAPTGKAAYVLQQKGLRNAMTIHRFCMQYRGRNEKGNPVFDFLPFSTDKVIIVDEASMVDAGIYEKLMSTGCRFLFVGDHGQLPPVGRDPGILRNPDIRLETVCRQAEGNPIRDFALAVRRGERPCPGNGIVQSVTEYDDSADTPETVILVGTNQKRIELNETLRRQDDTERILILANNYTAGLFNGQVVEATGVTRNAQGHPLSAIVNGRRVTFWPGAWLDPKPDLEAFREDTEESPEVVAADYGYALTVHKAQGSEWDRVVVWEDEIPMEDEPARWRYTAATRAKRELIYLVS